MDPELDEPDLRSYLGTISRRKGLVALVTALFLLVAAAMSFLTDPQYEVRAWVQTRGASELEDATSADLDRIAEAEMAYLTGLELAGAVSNTYEGPLSTNEIVKIDARELGTDERAVSSVVELSLVASEPEAAADLLNLYAQTYVEKVQQVETENQLSLIAGYLERLREIEEDLATTREPLDSLRQQIAEAETNGDSTQAALLRDQLNTETAIIQPQLSALGSEQGELERLVGEINTTIAVTGSTTTARLLAGAGVPTTPVSPNVPRNLAIGLVFGLFLGIAAAFLRDYFDDSVKSRAVVERVTGVPALGLIPRIDGSDGEFVAVTASGSPATEAYRSLRTSVKFLGVDRDVRVVQITSASAGEGKTVTACNLAAVLAQAGDRVVLVGGDLRRPRAGQLLGTSVTPGITEVLIGEIALPQAIRQVDGVPNLAFLPSGQPPPNPSELLSNERAKRLIDVLAQTYDVVILDCPPILPVTDSRVLARMADTTLLVASARQTSRRELERAMELLAQIDCRPAGTVITSLEPEESFTEPYSYDTIIPQQPRSSPASSNTQPHDGIQGPPDHANAGERADQWGMQPAGPSPSGQPDVRRPELPHRSG